MEPSIQEKASQWPSHGGQGAALLARFGLPADHPFEDFSANLNPLGPPAWVPGWLSRRLAELARYPEADYATARAAIAAHHDLTPGQVLLTNGGAEAIFLAAALHAGGRAAIVTPSFNEYARACRAHRIDVHSQPRLDNLDGIDAVFLCRPNNPTATLLSMDTLEALLTRTAALGCRVVIDEAFIDMSASVEDAQALPARLSAYPHAILLRSMTKFYTLPGLRLGYALTSAKTVDAMAQRQPPWSVNQLAAGLVAPLLADTDFAARTRAWLTRERPRLQAALEARGLEVVPSEACFFLLRPSSDARGRGITAEVLLERLLRGGILARHTHGFGGLNGEWLRLALRDADANNRLLKVLDDCLC